MAKNNEKYKKFLKYTGSKENEYLTIKEYLPNTIYNYYEPFFGGGAIFFKLKYDNLINNESYCNDLSKSLILFYNVIKNNNFKDSLEEIANCWKEIGTYSLSENNITKEMIKFLFDNFKDCLNKNKEITDVLNNEFKVFIEDLLTKKEYISKYNFHGYNLSDYIIKDLSERLKKFRDKKIEDIDRFTFDIIETSLHQSFYMLIRQLYNDWNSDEKKGEFTDIEKATHWYFIRQFCFGGMFRFGNKNKFNIPYGGHSYNHKCFSCNIEALFNTKSYEFIKDEKTIFTNLDYKEALNKAFNENDFIFLDPPYDSTFSSYDNLMFGENEQKELADFLCKLPCKWMLVIKKTEFIENLYKDKENIEIIEYGKKYKYSARGTYENEVTHLIIKNYKSNYGKNSVRK